MSIMGLHFDIDAEIEMEERSDGKMYAAHIKKLGLTTYGETRSHAKLRLEELLVKWAEWHIEHGLLHKRLSEMQVQWALSYNPTHAANFREAMLSRAYARAVEDPEDEHHA